MNADIEALYQKIGSQALAFVDDLQGKLLIYAEVEDGAISAGLFYERGALRAVTYKHSSLELKDLIYSLWEKWKAHPGNVEWRSFAYFVQNGKFSMDIVYPEQMDPDEDEPDRRPRIIEKYFGNAKVDYSRS